MIFDILNVRIPETRVDEDTCKKFREVLNRLLWLQAVRCQAEGTERAENSNFYVAYKTGNMGPEFKYIRP